MKVDVINSERLQTFEFVVPKCRRSILIKNNRYFLSFPSIIFNITYNKYGELYVGIGYKIDSDIYYVNLPNSYNLYICLGSQEKFREWRELDTNLLVNNFISYFWESKFSFSVATNIIKHIPNYKNPKMLEDYFIKWQEMTLKDINYCLDKENLKKICTEVEFKSVVVKHMIEDGFDEDLNEDYNEDYSDE